MYAISFEKQSLLYVGHGKAVGRHKLNGGYGSRNEGSYFDNANKWSSVSQHVCGGPGEERRGKLRY